MSGSALDEKAKGLVEEKSEKAVEEDHLLLDLGTGRDLVARSILFARVIN